MNQINFNSIKKAKKISLYFLIITISLLSFKKEEIKFKILDLEIEYLSNPIGIDAKSPRFSWKLVSQDKIFQQSAYRILVASSKKYLNNDTGDIWDSAIIKSNESSQIIHNGKKLNSRQQLFWKVKVWNEESKASKWSDISTWEMGLLQGTDWKAKWIGKEELENPEVGKKNPTSYFRKEFTVNNDISNARVYISGIGYYELYINGKKVGDHVLSPNQTNYDKTYNDSFDDNRIANMSTRVLYETYDISSYLKKGENVVAVILGNGWYYRMAREEYLPLSYDLPRFIAQIELRNSKGKIQQVISDTSWKNNTGPLVENSIYYGEIYDARKEQNGWNNIKFDDKNWKKSKILRSPDGKLHAQMSPPDRVTGTIEPVSITTLKKGIYRYDFGTMYSGWVKIKVKGKRGNQLKLTFLEDNGNTYEQSDTYILKGVGTEVWEPKFTWHTFRFVDVISPDIVITKENLTGMIVHTDVNSAGTFNSSNKLFNRILSDYKKTQLDNMHGGIPSDCPHRERRGYTGDGQISAQSAIYSLDMKSFYTKWINDIADSQNKKTGYVPYTAPYQSGGGGTPWGSAYIIIPWYMYLYYGDTSILNDHYEGMKLYLDYLKSKCDDDNLIIEDQLGEWVPPVATVIPPSFVSSAYYFYDLTLMNRVANILKKEKDAQSFLELKDQVKNSFNKRYFNPKESSYSIGWQGANVFPLAFDLVSKENEKAVFKSLVRNVDITAKGHFDTGMMGTPYLLEVLTNYGRSDLAYTVMNRKDFPSFGYNIERGATSLWETWTGNESHSHPMFGSVTAWFFQGLGGINPDPENPGFKHIIIKPNPIDELDFVNTSYPSVYGDIQSNWEFQNGNFKLEVSIPPNSNATIYIPGNKKENINTNGKNIAFLGIENNYVKYKVSSGEYSFESKNIKDLFKSPLLSIPVIYPSDSTLFSPASVSIKITQDSRNGTIRYTLDGSEPNENSTLYKQEFNLQKSTVIKARVFRKDQKPGYIKTNKIVFIDSLKNGLQYNYYVGAWNKLPDFSKLKSVKKGKVYNIDLLEINDLGNQFAVLFTGMIDIKLEGDYTFYLSSNDGSKLFIDDKEIVDADGAHGFGEISGQVFLTKGTHQIKLEYFQAGGGKGLELRYSGPKTEKQFIPADILTLN